MDFILGINERIIFKQTNKKSPRGIVAIKKSCKLMSLYEIFHLVPQWNHLLFFPWLFFFFYSGGWREITSWQLQTPTDSLTWVITTGKKTDTTPMLLSPEGKYDQVWVLKPCKSGPKWYMCRDWHFAARNVSFLQWELISTSVECVFTC